MAAASYQQSAISAFRAPDRFELVADC